MKFWDVRIKRVNSVIAQIDSKGKKVKEEYGELVAARYVDKGIGFCKGTDANKAKEYLKTARRTQHGSVKWESYIPVRDEYIITHELPDVDECIEYLHDVVEVFDKKYINFFKAMIVYSYEEMWYENSEGSDIVQGIPRIRVIAYLKGRKGRSWQGTYNIHSFIGGFESLGDPHKFANETLDILKLKLKAKKAPAGCFPVITDNELSGVFVHEALGHACEADHLLQHMSVLEGKIGKKIASDISISDNPLVNSFGHYKYDDEGIPAREKFLIKDGVLCDLLHSRLTAAQMDSLPSGNGRAMGNEFPIPRMSNIVIYPGKVSKAELFEDIKYGIYAIGSNGGQVDPKTGNFVFNANYGFIIKNGELADPIVDVTLSGNILSVLKQVKAASDAIASIRGGMCGKEGQSVPVSEVSPHLYVGEVIVGGSQRV